MGRPRTPTHVLELRGSFKKNPHRRAERFYTAADALRDAEQRGPWPEMPSSWEIDEENDTPRRKELRLIWGMLERNTRNVSIPAANLKLMPFVCRLLYKCRYGRATAEDRERAGRWLRALRLSESYASRQ